MNRVVSLSMPDIPLKYMKFTIVLTPCDCAALEETGANMGSGAHMVRLLHVKIVSYSQRMHRVAVF